jgi:hypothetical protein
MSPEKTSFSFQAQVSAFHNDLSKLILVQVCSPSVLDSLETEKIIFQFLRLKVDDLAFADAAGQLLKQLNCSKELLVNLKTVFNEHSKKSRFPQILVTINKLDSLCDRLTNGLQSFIFKSQKKTEESDQLSFVFVESQLISAIRSGCWVLFDNINSYNKRN